MENIKKDIVFQSFNKPISEFRYTITAVYRKKDGRDENICAVCATEGADTAEVIRNALAEHYKNYKDVEFMVDDIHEAFNFSELLDIIADENTAETV